MTTWECALCGHVVESDERPNPKWDDGHICIMIEQEKLKFSRQIQQDYEDWLDYRATRDDNIHIGDN